MAYRNKEATLAEAARLGIDVSGLGWPEMQKVVKEALERERLGMNPDVGKAVDTDGDKPVMNHKPAMEPAKMKSKKNPYDASNYRFKKKVLAPELRPDANRIIRYEEDLGEGVEVEESSFMGYEGKGAIQYTMNRDYATST